MYDKAFKDYLKALTGLSEAIKTTTKTRKKLDQSLKTTKRVLLNQ